MPDLEGDERVAEARIYTMRELSQRTAQVIDELNRFNQQALITRHGKPIAVITPLANAHIESFVLSSEAQLRKLEELVKESNALPSYSSDETHERIRTHYKLSPDGG